MNRVQIMHVTNLVKDPMTVPSKIPGMWLCHLLTTYMFMVGENMLVCVWDHDDKNCQAQ